MIGEENRLTGAVDGADVVASEEAAVGTAVGADEDLHAPCVYELMPNLVALHELP